MSDYQVHTVETAPEKSRPAMEGIAEKIGFVPNILSVLAESPTALKAYLVLSGTLGEGSLSNAERQVILLTASYENECVYCMAAHTTLAAGQKVDKAVVEAIREGQPIADLKLEALRVFARDVVVKRGRVSSEDVDKVTAAGYTKAQILEVVVGVALKTLTNYSNHIVSPPVDPEFAANEWQHPDKR